MTSLSFLLPRAVGTEGFTPACVLSRASAGFFFKRCAR
jgi:hypothetical protein